MYRSSFAACALLAHPLFALQSATLDAVDVSTGAASMGASTFDLHGGHDLDFVVGGEPGELVLLAISPQPASFPLLIGGVPLHVDVASFSLLANGLASPSDQVGGDGEYTFAVTVPNGLPVGATIYSQAGLIDTSTFSLRLTGGLDLLVVTSSDAQDFVKFSAGSSGDTTGHYAIAVAVTVNDPSPKLVAPGGFTSSLQDQLLLHSIENPAVITDAFTWSGGDALGLVRDQLAVDGTTPGIDRIFFTAAASAFSPRFVDWTGSAFTTEGVLAPAVNHVQSLCVTDEGDLIANDFSGNVYLWDKSDGYAQSLLFTFTNDPASLPYGDPLHQNLGKIGYDPASDLILFPVNNLDLSPSGQLYGFDLAGNRVLADQDLMGGPLPGNQNAFRFGVTIAPASVLVHGGRDGGNFFVARFTGGMTQKTVTQSAGDFRGGWMGGLAGTRFFTNTNIISYGITERSIPAHW